LPTGTPHPSEKTSRRTSRVGRGRYVDEPGSRRVDGAAAFCGAAELSVRFGIRAPEAVVADVVCRAEAGVACGCPRGWESSWLWLWPRWSPPRRRYSAQHDELIARRRADPVDDLVSALITAEADGDRLSTQELRSLITGLVLAGQDTTRNQLGLALKLFAQHHKQWALLAARPELAASAVEEVTRVRPTVTSTGRWSTDQSPARPRARRSRDRPWRGGDRRRLLTDHHGRGREQPREDVRLFNRRQRGYIGTRLVGGSDLCEGSAAN